MGHDILELVQALHADVGHADFLPLVDKRRAALQHVHRGEHFSALHTVGFAPVTADNPRMIVILYIQRVPGLALQLLLPVGKGPLHLPQVELRLDHIRHEAVRFHVRERDHLVQHLLRSLRNIAQRDVRRGQGTLPHRETVVVVQHIMLEFLQVFVRLRLIGVIAVSVCNGQLRVGIRKPRRFADVGNHILTEAVHAHVEPESHDPLDLFPDLRVGHIQIGLFFGKQVQIILVQELVIFPRAAFKHAGPVVRRIALAPADPAVAPDIVVVIGIVVRPSALLEPGVLVRGMVHHQIHENPHSHSVGAVEHLAEGIQGSVIPVNVHVVRNIIAEIRIRRRVDRGKPDRVHAKALDIVQLLQNAEKVTNAVAVSVTEAAHPDLVNRHFLVPLCFRQSNHHLPSDFLLVYHKTYRFCNGHERKKEIKKGLTAGHKLWYHFQAEKLWPCGCSSMVEHQPSKLDTWVRFPSPAPIARSVLSSCRNMRQ